MCVCVCVYVCVCCVCVCVFSDVIQCSWHYMHIVCARASVFVSGRGGDGVKGGEISLSLCVYKQMHAQVHAHARTHIHKHARSYTHTHTHTHMHSCRACTCIGELAFMWVKVEAVRITNNKMSSKQCNKLQQTATHCNKLRHTVTQCSAQLKTHPPSLFQCTFTCTDIFTPR